MGHHEQCHAGTFQIPLEPLYGGDVEVVGRLVEYDQLRFLQNYFCECHTLSLAAGQMPHRLIEIGDSELCKHLLQAVLVVPRLCGIHFSGGLRESLHVFRCNCGFISLYGLQKRLVVGHACLEHGKLGLQRRCLFEIPDSKACAGCDRAAVIWLETGYTAEKGSLPHAVFCYQSYFVALVYSESDVTEKKPITETFCEILYLEENCHRIVCFISLLQS